MFMDSPGQSSCLRQIRRLSLHFHFAEASERPGAGVYKKAGSVFDQDGRY
jgi:hypothetical protein